VLASIIAAAAKDFHALPVVAPGNVLAGIITSTDLVEALRDALVYRVAQDSSAGEESRAGSSVSAAADTALRTLYRMVGHYINSGRGDIEHGRLLQAWDHAREHLESRNTPL